VRWCRGGLSDSGKDGGSTPWLSRGGGAVVVTPVNEFITVPRGRELGGNSRRAVDARIGWWRGRSDEGMVTSGEEKGVRVRWRRISRWPAGEGGKHINSAQMAGPRKCQQMGC
jgi:hypothetical protein